MSFDPNLTSAVAATASASAAFFSLIVAWFGPKRAAQVAEKLRIDNEKRNEQERAKRAIFFTLMQERGAPNSLEGARALNSIDAMFYNATDVREAWSSLYASYDGAAGFSPHVQKERLVKLLRFMAKDIGIQSSLGLEDFSRIYYPESLAKEAMVREIQRNNIIASSNATLSNKTSNL